MKTCERFLVCKFRIAWSASAFSSPFPFWTVSHQLTTKKPAIRAQTIPIITSEWPLWQWFRSSSCSLIGFSRARFTNVLLIESTTTCRDRWGNILVLFCRLAYSEQTRCPGLDEEVKKHDLSFLKWENTSSRYSSHSPSVSDGPAIGMGFPRTLMRNASNITVKLPALWAYRNVNVFPAVSCSDLSSLLAPSFFCCTLTHVKTAVTPEGSKGPFS